MLHDQTRYLLEQGNCDVLVDIAENGHDGCLCVQAVPFYHTMISTRYPPVKPHVAAANSHVLLGHAPLTASGSPKDRVIDPICGTRKSRVIASMLHAGSLSLGKLATQDTCFFGDVLRYVQCLSSVPPGGEFNMSAIVGNGLSWTPICFPLCIWLRVLFTFDDCYGVSSCDAYPSGRVCCNICWIPY